VESVPEPVKTSSHAAPRRRPALLLLTFVPALIIIGLDQWTKHVVETHMTLGQRIDVIGSWFQWHFIKNSGVAFSIGQNSTWVATILASVITIVVVIIALRTRHRVWSLATGLVLGGAIGNLIDRLFREPGFGIGHVVDFIAVGTFPRFNIADSSVCVGVAIAIILLFRGIDPWPPRGSSSMTDTSADEDRA
jgi:signal peptidase II